MNLNRPTYCLILSAVIMFLAGCDSGLQPPPVEGEVASKGAISGTVTYTGEWPPDDELRQLFFVPLTFVPSGASEIVTEFISGNLIASESLETNVDSDTFFVDELPNGVYVYNGIANQFGSRVFSDWRVLGLYSDNDGIIIIEGDTVEISIEVDFDNLPPFPPE